ncbi:MAG TPA: signal peptide peptidase SppA [bacterium]|nr:signal peptide peptidase SppA [bacterium]
MRKQVVIGISVVIGIILFVFIGSFAVKASKKIAEASGAGKKIALINITGEITDVTHILRQINQYTDMAAVRVIVFRVNSPGGGPGASQELYRQVRKAKNAGKKIVVSMTDVAASGAYYVSMAADKIYANPSTLTGSIGVYMSFINAEKLLEKIGVGFETVKSGQFKDTGNFSRKATEKELALLKGLIEDVHNQFVDDVVDARMEPLKAVYNIESDDNENIRAALRAKLMSAIGDGRILTGREAMKLGLVDAIGNIDDAIEAAAAMAGIPGRPSVLSERRKPGFAEMLSSALNGLGLRETQGPVIKYIMN